MRITRGKEWHTIGKVKNACFGNNPLGQGDVVDVVSRFLGEEDIGICEFEGFSEGGFGLFGVGLGEFWVWIEVVEEETGFGACKLKNVLDGVVSRRG